MRALVTGGTGFIGGALAAALLDSGWQVNLLVRPGRAGRLPAALRLAVETGQACLYEADLARPNAALRPAVVGCAVVFHAAAIRDRWGATAEAYRQVNVEGTRRLLEASLGQAQRFVHVSSVGVLGRPGVLGVDETFPVVSGEGSSLYHNAKAEAEQAVLSHLGEIEVTIARPTITYGPGDADGAITRLVALIARGGFVRVCPGRNHLHLTYIDDLVQGLLLAGTHTAAAGETFILAGPDSIPLGVLLAKIEARLGQPPRRLSLPEGLARRLAWGVELAYRAGRRLSPSILRGVPPITSDKIHTLCAHRSFSSAKAARLLGFAPQVGYDEGLEMTLAWMAGAGLLPRLLPVPSSLDARPNPSNPAEVA